MCNNVYCIVQLFEKNKCFIEEIDANQSINDTLDRFFLISQLTNNLILIKIEDIKSKCVYSVSCDLSVAPAPGQSAGPGT